MYHSMHCENAMAIVGTAHILLPLYSSGLHTNLSTSIYSTSTVILQCNFKMDTGFPSTDLADPDEHGFRYQVVNHVTNILKLLTHLLAVFWQSTDHSLQCKGCAEAAEHPLHHMSSAHCLPWLAAVPGHGLRCQRSAEWKG